MKRALGAAESRAEVLHGIDLTITQGEFCAIMGPSGSGKSTLMYLLGALDRPTSGSVAIEGRDTRTLDERALAAVRNEKIGFIFQFHHLMPEFTAFENVSMPLLRAGVGRVAARRRAEELLLGLGLAEKGDRTPDRLSGGERQRVAIARSLANDPVVVLGDEPTGNLDTKNSDRVFSIFERLARDTHQTIVVVTHDPAMAARTDRIIRIVDGRIVDDGKSRDVLARLDAPLGLVGGGR